ncbi:toll/interleukin-1 receptor domain-containing protein [Streptomyces sp. NPDC098789]|uniref:toll/interleukin-1 receptor domain-containing protein n=1 Tax=Streptomyces sp. NPDC098789 TaxID=3366098 RepID=UPI003805B3FC
MERDAFISYSHQQDSALAQGLQRGLHRLARPWTRRRTINVFRDTTSLAATSDLGGSIRRELANSRYLIYLASPAAAESRWVREEVEFWITHRSMDRFLIAVSRGTIAWDPGARDFDWEKTDVFPDVLRGRFTTEPLWVDLVDIRESGEFSLRRPEFRDAVATLAAPLHGRTKDALDSEDLRHRLATRILRTAVVTLALLLVTSLIAGAFAWQQRDTALARARTSASLALAARSLEIAGSDPRKAAQFALYADEVEPTGEAAQALGRAVAANGRGTARAQTGAPVANPQQLKREEFTADHGLALRDVDGGTDVWRVSAAPSGALQRLGHLPVAISRKPGSTDSVVVTADGTRAAVSQAAKMSLWDLRTGKRIGSEMPIEDDEPQFLSFLPDDVHALVQWKKDVSVVDTRSWESGQRIPYRTDPLLRVGISGDRSTFAFTGSDTTTIWRWSGGKLVKQPSEMPGPLRIHTVAFTGNGAKAAAVDTDGRVHILDVASGRIVESTSVTQQGTTAIAFSPDGRLLVQAIPKGKDSFLQFWDADTGEARGTWALDGQPLGTEWHDRSVLNDPDGQILTFGSDGSLVRRGIDVASWRRILCGVVSDPLSKTEHDRYLSELAVSAPCPPRA